MKEILDKVVEVGMILAAQEGDIEARDTVIENNLGLVYYCMKNYSFLQQDTEVHTSLFTEGVLGLMTAIEQYDPTKGKFVTFAYYKIRSKQNYFIRSKLEKYETEFEISELDIPVDDTEERNLKNSVKLIIPIIKELPKDLPKIVYLRGVLGHTYQEIADVLNVSRQSVAVKYGKGLLLLKDKLKVKGICCLKDLI